MRTRRLAHGALGALGAALLAGLLLAGCGGARAGELSGGGSASSGGATATATATRGPLPPVKAPTATATTPAGGAPVAGGAGVTTLTMKNAATTTDVAQGTLLQAQLSSGYTWVYAGQSVGLLKMTTPSDVTAANGMRLWTFRAQATGDTTLRFLGKPACQANVPCSQVAIALSFKVRVVA